MPTRRSNRPPSNALPPTPPILDDVVSGDVLPPTGSMPVPEPNYDQPTRFTGERIDYRSRSARIERLAYLIAEGRGFEPGHELDDWLEAERRIDAGDG